MQQLKERLEKDLLEVMFTVFTSIFQILRDKNYEIFA